MGKSRAKKSILNIVSGFVSQIVMICLGIVIPRLVLVNLGSEVNGLLNSVNQILVYAGLLEAGVGLATTQALYGPLARNDAASVNGVMSATSIYYKRTGVVYSLVVLAISLVYPLIVSSDIPNWIIFSVIILSGMPSVVNYYYQGKYKLLLNADGRSYIITTITLCINVCTSISKILLLLLGFDVVALQLMYFAFSILQMAFYVVYVRKNYQWLDLKAKPDYQSISQKNSVLIHQISGLVFNNTDMILLTAFCGLKTVSVYSMYILLFGMIGTAVQTINSGVMFTLGQTYNSDKKAFIPMHNAFELYNMTLTFSLFCIANIFILPFMKLYTSGISDINYVDQLLPYLFVATYLLDNGRTASMKVINYAGHFKQTKHHALIEMVINLTMSIIGVNLFGIYGVLAGTIAALLFRTNAMILYASKNLLNKSCWLTYRRWLLNALMFVVVTVISKQISFPVDNYVGIVLSAIGCSVVVIPLFFVVASIMERDTSSYFLDYIKTYIGRGSRGSTTH